MTKRYRKVAFFIFVIVQLSIAMIYSITSTLDGYIQLYYFDKENDNAPIMLDRLKWVQNTMFVKYYGILSGLDTGYGFFAPNVASVCQIQFEIKRSTGSELLNMPQLNSVESISRYATLMGQFQQKLLSVNKSGSENQYLDVVIKAMATQMLKRYEDANSVVAVLYVSKYPSLKSYSAGHVGSLIFPVDRYEIKR